MEYLNIYNDNHELIGECEKELSHKWVYGMRFLLVK